MLRRERDAVLEASSRIKLTTYLSVKEMSRMEDFAIVNLFVPQNLAKYKNR